MVYGQFPLPCVHICAYIYFFLNFSHPVSPFCHILRVTEETEVAKMAVWSTPCLIYMLTSLYWSSSNSRSCQPNLFPWFSVSLINNCFKLLTSLAYFFYLPIQNILPQTEKETVSKYQDTYQTQALMWVNVVSTTKNISFLIIPSFFLLFYVLVLKFCAVCTFYTFS